jgi:hypothetical protein
VVLSDINDAAVAWGSGVHLAGRIRRRPSLDLVRMVLTTGYVGGRRRIVSDGEFDLLAQAIRTPLEALAIRPCGFSPRPESSSAGTTVVAFDWKAVARRFMHHRRSVTPGGDMGLPGPAYENP